MATNNAINANQTLATTSDVTFDSLTFSNTAKGIVGTTTNDNAGAGYVGQFISSQVTFASATAISTGTATSLTSISLTAGDWQVWGSVYINPSSSGIINSCAAGISTTNNTLPDNSLINQVSSNAGTTNALSACGMPAPTQRISVAGTTTVYIVGFVGLNSGTATQCGFISARRLR